MTKFETNEKKQLLISTDQDKNVLFWGFDNNGSLKLKQKLQGCKAPIYAICDLKDCTNIITGDDSGEILVYDFTKNEIQFAFNDIHKSRIIFIQEVKPNLIAMIGQGDVITYWKTYYQQNKLIDFRQFKIIQKELGGIRSVFTQNNNLGWLGDDGYIRCFDYTVLQQLDTGIKNKYGQILQIQSQNLNIFLFVAQNDKNSSQLFTIDNKKIILCRTNFNKIQISGGQGIFPKLAFIQIQSSTQIAALDENNQSLLLYDIII